jgi:nitric oxide reductase subunit B
MSFWCLNVGLAWMVFVTLLPLGVLQLYHSVNEGYFEARSLGYITKPGNAVIEWLRMPGDLILIAGGVLPFVWIAWTALRNFRSGTTVQELPEHPLYIESEVQAKSGAGSTVPAKD